MHVLVTADSLSGSSLSGSWTYTRELVTGLVTRGVRVTLVSFGEIPLPDQTAWMDHLHGLDYRPTAFHLEWMQEAEEDFAESSTSWPRWCGNCGRIFCISTNFATEIFRSMSRA